MESKKKKKKKNPPTKLFDVFLIPQKTYTPKKGTFLFYGFGLFLSLIFWLVFLIMPEQVLGLFLKNKELISLGRTNAMLAMSLFPLSAIMIINLTLFQALGKAKYAGILVIARQFLLYIPAVLILPVFFGTRGVWISTPIIDTLVTVLSAFIVIKLFKKDLSTKDKALSA